MSFLYSPEIILSSSMKKKMQETVTILEGYSDNEKGAYLGAIASIATADRQASEEELSYLQALSESAD